MNSSKMLLKRFDFVSYLLGNVITQFGSDLVQFTVSLYILEKTGSATLFATMLSIIVLPRFLISPIAGVLADRLDRKKILMALNMLNGLVIAGFGGLLSNQTEPPLVLFFGLVVYLEAVETFYQPAAGAVFPTILAKNQLATANSLSQGVMTISVILSPLLAGWLYRAERIGGIMLLAGLLYLVAMFSKLPLQLGFTKKESETGVGTIWTEFRQGIAYINQNKVLWRIVGLAATVNFVLAPLIQVTWVYAVRESFGFSAKMLAISQSILMAGLIIGSLLSMYITNKWQLGNIFIGVIFVFAGLTSLLTLNFIINFELMKSPMNTYRLALPLFFLFTTFSVSVNVSLGTFIQKTTPLDIMGRLMTVLSMVSMGAVPIGSLLFGFMSDWFPIYASFGVSALVLWLVSVKYVGSIKQFNDFVRAKEEANTEETGSFDLEERIDLDREAENGKREVSV